MQQTIFKELHQLYSLKKPSTRNLPPQSYQNIQILALMFYQFLFQKELHFQPFNPQIIAYFTVLHRYYETSPKSKGSINQEQVITDKYHDIFIALYQKRTDAMDYIGCIICLIGDFILLKENQQIGTEESIKKRKKSLSVFFDKLMDKKIDLKQYLYILYTKLTINLQISVLTARKIFKKFILHTTQAGLIDFNAKMKFMQQWESIQKNLKNPTNIISEARKIKIKRRQVCKNSYVTQLHSIIKHTQEQIAKEHNSQNFSVQNQPLDKKENFLINQSNSSSKITSKFHSKRVSNQRVSKLSQIKRFHLPNLHQIMDKKSKTENNTIIIDPHNLEYWQSQLRQIKNMPDENCISVSKLKKSDFYSVRVKVQQNSNKSEDHSLMYRQRMASLLKLLPKLQVNNQIQERGQEMLQKPANVASKQKVNTDSHPDDKMIQTNKRFWLHHSDYSKQNCNKVINQKMRLPHKSGQLKKQMHKFIKDICDKEQ